jgi:hypothetical protein
MSYSLTTRASALAAIALITSVTGVANIASADRDSRGNEVEIHSSGSSSISISSSISSRGRETRFDRFIDRRDNETGIEFKKDGSVTLRGAKVTAVSGATLTVTETYGPAILSWTVQASGAQVQTRNGSAITLADVVVGDTVTVKGTLVSGSTFAVTATLVRDITKAPTAPPISNTAQQIFEGTLSVLPGAALPTSLTLTVGGVAKMVNVSTTTTLLNASWAAVALSLFQIGDTVRVFGFVPSGSTAITGLVVRNTSR